MLSTTVAIAPCSYMLCATMGSVVRCVATRSVARCPSEWELTKEEDDDADTDEEDAESDERMSSVEMEGSISFVFQVRRSVSSWESQEIAACNYLNVAHCTIPERE